MQKTIGALTLTVAIIGCLNWGLIGLFDFNLVVFLFGEMTLLTRVIYVLVGLSALYLLTFYMKLD